MQEKGSTGSNRHKPWPSRKANKVEEAAANYMSNDPHYLHRVAKGDGVQEKALSVGVFDWERLEKLAYLEKQDGNRRGGDPPSLSNASPPSSILVLSLQSSRGNGSPLVQRKQSPTPDSHRSSSAGDRRSKLLKENRSGRATGSPDAPTLNANSSVRHDHERIKSRDTGSIGIYHKMSQSADYDYSSFAHKQLSNQFGRSREAEKLNQCEEHCYACNLHPAIESVQKRRFSFDSAIENSVIIGDLNPLVSKSRINESAETEVPVTKMKSATTPRRDLSPQRLFAAGLNRLRSSSVREGSSVNRRSCLVPLSSASDSKHEKFTHKSFEPFPVIIADRRSGQDEAKAATGPARHDLSPHRLLAAGLNRLRSNSVKERSSGQQMNQTTTSVHSTEDYAASNSKGRRSPLRRMFDPLLKPKNRMQFSGPVVSLASHQGSELNSSDRLHIHDELKSAKGPPRSSNAAISPSTIHINEPRCSVQDESCVTSTRQAVLELAWKNGLPLFVFSSDNNDILAATIGKRNDTSEQKDYECLYTIFTAHEVKKKGGAWMSQGNKSKKQGLVYNVVGHIKASFLKPAGCFPKSDSEMREFILFGSELTPTTEKHVSSFNSELAAIVVKAPSDVLQSSKPMMSSAAADVSSCCQSPENLAMSSIVAVLPKGVHGLSSEGEPSPLIERWRSGGSCDCGGWDEGCILSVLTERRECTSTHRIELFAQASEARANKHAFSMDNFGEGIYTVDFRASVASVQAFAICVAILHSRNSTDLSCLKYPAEAQNLQEGAFPDYYTEMASAKTEGEEPSNYVPDPPPPSPGGRA